MDEKVIRQRYVFDGGLNADVIRERNAGEGVTIDGFLIQDGGFSVGPTGVLGLGGVNEAFALDFDGDTTISASVDDLIDINLNGATDFQIGINVLTAVAGSSFVAVDADAVLVGGVIVPQHIEIDVHVQVAADAVDRVFFTANRAYQVVGVRQVHSTAEATAADLRVQITKDTGTAAPGAGTALLTNNTNAGFDLKATANTVQTGTLTATTASLQLATGNRLALDFEDAATELAGVHLTVTLKRI